MLKFLSDLNAKLKRTGLMFILGFSLILGFVGQNYKVPSGSMVPTLLEGDYLVGWKFAYGYTKHSFWGLIPFEGKIFARPVRRGDVVIFKPVEIPNTYFVKRAIAVGGDKVYIKEGTIYINDVPAKLDYKQTYSFYLNPKYSDDMIEAKLFIENLPGGKQHPALFTENFTNQTDNFPTIEIPENYIFVVGDNRDYSGDNRGYLKLVPEENVVAKAGFIIFSKRIRSMGAPSNLTGDDPKFMLENSQSALPWFIEIFKNPNFYKFIASAPFNSEFWQWIIEWPLDVRLPRTLSVIS